MINRKKEFKTHGGSEGMIIDCNTYEVEIFKSMEKDYYGQVIKYTDKKSKNSLIIGSNFNIDWDKEEDGGRLEIKFRDRWGCEMIFIHFNPTDLKGMFDFIGKGYNIFDKGFGLG